MSIKYYIGIDPGATGAMAIIYVRDTFHIEWVYDFNGPVGLRELKVIAFEMYPVKAVIEKVGTMPGQGIASSGNFMENYGRWQGRLEALGIPFDRITPQKWKKEMFDYMPAGPNLKSIISPDKAEQAKLRRSAKSKHQRKMKTFSRERATTLFPSMAHMFARVKDDGRAEALLMAEYCRRMDR